MVYSLLADTVLIIHLLFILLVLFGGLLALWKRWLIWLHLPVLLWGVGIEWIGWVCPLTPLEVDLRRAAGAEGYAGGFLQHYLFSLIYPEGLTRGMQIGLGTAVLVLNLGIYLWVWRRLRRQDYSQ